MGDIFSDEDDDLDDRRRHAREPGGIADEFADFIEEDEFPEDEDPDRDVTVAKPRKKGLAGIDGVQGTGLDEAALEDMRAAFGDGTEYDWALEMQYDLDDDEKRGDGEPTIKDFFEPSQLVDKMLTDEDDQIRRTDVPERFQILRKPFKQIELSEEESAARAKEEALWVANMLLPKKRLDRHLVEPFQRAVSKVLEFINVEDFEVPFIMQHRKDYIIHEGIRDGGMDEDGFDQPESGSGAVRLLTQNELWEILELDLKFRALVEKRDALQRAYDNLRSVSGITDKVFEDMLPTAVNMEEIQDIQEYLHFQYSAELKDVNTAGAESNGIQKRARATRSLWEKLRAGKVYNMVRAFGISADSFAQNVLATGRRQYTEDPSEKPDYMADSLVDHPEYSTGEQILRAAKAMYAAEISMSPRMRKLMRQNFYQSGLFDCYRTEKGARQITEDHRYYEFKYLRRQDFTAIARRPEMYLRMLKAEQEGLIEVKIRLDGYNNFKESLYKNIESDNFSEVADAWNVLRKEVLDMALTKLEKIMERGVKETLKAECENQLARACRDKYLERLDEAPYKPKGMVIGTTPRVLALSNGQGNAGRDAICWVWVEEDGRVLEHGKFVDLRLGNSEKYIPDGQDVAAFVELVQRRKPDVLGISGFSVETRKLYKDLQDIIDKHDLRCPEYEDEDGNEKSEKLEVVIVNDEVARLYHTSERSAADHPGLAPLTRYCIALAKYMQGPVLEYAALGKDIVSISFNPNQDLLPKDKLVKHLESAMVDIVNLVGVKINDAVSDSYLANLLPYVCGLGPRKADHMLKVINRNVSQLLHLRNFFAYNVIRKGLYHLAMSWSATQTSTYCRPLVPQYGQTVQASCTSNTIRQSKTQTTWTTLGFIPKTTR